MGEKGRRTRQAICQSACQLFAEKGFKDVTMKDICERTHLSRGGLYRHYGSTREIFIEIVDSLMRQQADDFGGKMEQGVPAGDILDEVLKRYESEMADAGSSLSVALYEFFSSPEYSGNDHSMYEQYRQSAEMWERLLEYGIKRGEFLPVDTEAVIDLILFSYQGVRMYSKLMPVDPRIPKRILSQIRLILTGKE